MIGTVWRISSYKGHLSIIGENAQIRTELVPARGSKLVSLMNKQTGREWIYTADQSNHAEHANDADQSNHTDRFWKEPLSSGMAWDAADRSGWDELFPTISPCLSPDAAFSGRQLPDHGEVWSLPWEYAIKGDDLELWVKGVQLPYLFRKTYRIEESALHIQYELQNCSSHSFSYIWAPHCLLKIEAGMKLAGKPFAGIQPPQQILMRHSKMERFESEAVYSTYPFIKTKEGQIIDMRIVEPKLQLHAEKYWFVNRVTEGNISIQAPQTKESFQFEYSAEDLPYLAIWSNYGGYWNDYNLAIEPSTSFLDDVESSSYAGKVKTIQGHSTESWYLKVSLQQDM
ncbi:DUF4432 family protein [Paenibacillus eucommiae]|uniref:DUF5107 domain-containing protein n=1 Tax=Paenibacillus eucommiae TaxID=1355755 RepID=A0ABS4IZG8_9BACL|nr:DUF4432 family protein [Paenibacillus eucommiae]MBP1992992.1 hypothetical protein [Paenibacillus eucommiae]